MFSIKIVSPLTTGTDKSMYFSSWLHCYSKDEFGIETEKEHVGTWNRKMSGFEK
jgi:hypothetical protein